MTLEQQTSEMAAQMILDEIFRNQGHTPDIFDASRLLMGGVNGITGYREALDKIRATAAEQNAQGGVGSKPEQTVWRFVEGIMQDDHRDYVTEILNPSTK